MKTSPAVTTWLSLLVLATLLAACAGMPQPLSTQTGRPEVTIPHVSIENVKGAISNTMLNRGYYVKNVSDYSAVYEKREEGLGMALLAGSRYDATPVWRITYNYVPLNGNVRIVTNIHLVTNAGSAFERVTDVSTSSKDAHNIQRTLEQIRANFSNAGLGKVGLGFNDKLVITQLTPSGTAEKAGIKLGDRIVAVDGIQAEIAKPYSVKIAGELGTSVDIMVDRNGSVQTFTVVRGQP